MKDEGEEEVTSARLAIYYLLTAPLLLLILAYDFVLDGSHLGTGGQFIVVGYYIKFFLLSVQPFVEGQEAYGK